MRISGTRRAGLAVGVLALVGSLAPSALANDRMAAPGDDAIGSAVNAFPVSLAGPGTARLSVWARSDPAGAHPNGTVRATGNGGAPATGFTVSGPVTCLRVVGNRASIKYTFTRADGAAAALKGGGVEVFVEDNGDSRRRPDANAFGAPMPAGAFQASQPTSCDDPNTGDYTPVRSGGYTVHNQPGARSGTP